jgi:hypothetical protein
VQKFGTQPAGRDPFQVVGPRMASCEIQFDGRGGLSSHGTYFNEKLEIRGTYEVRSGGIEEMDCCGVAVECSAGGAGWEKYPYIDSW